MNTTVKNEIKDDLARIIECAQDVLSDLENGTYRFSRDSIHVIGIRLQHILKAMNSKDFEVNA
jgi:hypothetical protein